MQRIRIIRTWNKAKSLKKFFFAVCCQNCQGCKKIKKYCLEYVILPCFLILFISQKKVGELYISYVSVDFITKTKTVKKTSESQKFVLKMTQVQQRTSAMWEKNRFVVQFHIK